MNKLTIIGNLTRDPELRTTTSGVNVCSFTVAVNRRNRRDDQNGQPEADFFRVTAWRQLADICSKYLAKGRKVCVVGAVSVHTYTGNDGTTRASLEVTADDVEFLSARNETKPQAATVPPPLRKHTLLIPRQPVSPLLKPMNCRSNARKGG
jgi:single stranded DNA-binding protein (ssb)